jgi:methylmalonyl-CoA mutase C-terminal domain/subunit
MIRPHPPHPSDPLVIHTAESVHPVFVITSGHCLHTFRATGLPSEIQTARITLQHEFVITGFLIMAEERIRVLLAKPGLDGHDRGVKVIARALRDAGMEVIYTGLRQTPEQVVSASLQEDVDAIGLSILSGAHMTLFPRVVELAHEAGLKDVIIFGGGIIPDEDIPRLKELGVSEIFTPGTRMEDIITYIRQHARRAQTG